MVFTGTKIGYQKGLFESNLYPVKQGVGISGGMNNNAQVVESFNQEILPVINSHSSGQLAVQLSPTSVAPLLNDGCVKICSKITDFPRIQTAHPNHDHCADVNTRQSFVQQGDKTTSYHVVNLLAIEPRQAQDSTLSDESNSLFSNSATKKNTDLNNSVQLGFPKRTLSSPDRIKLLDASHPQISKSDIATATYLH